MRLFLLALVAASACSIDAGVSRQVGARCDRKDECAERCLADPDFPGGFCSLSCLGDRDCPGEGVCADVAGGVCLFSCAIDADCAFLGAGSWRCAGASGLPDGEVRVCLGN